MRIEFWLNSQTEEPHIYDHGVTDDEVKQVLEGPRQNRPGHDGAFVALGPTDEGRYLKVIFRSLPDGVVFVITAYPAPKGSIRIYNRQNRRKR